MLGWIGSVTWFKDFFILRLCPSASAESVTDATSLTSNRFSHCFRPCVIVRCLLLFIPY